MPEVPQRYPQGLADPLDRSPSVAEIYGKHKKDSTLDNFEGGGRSSAANKSGQGAGFSSLGYENAVARGSEKSKHS